MAHPVRVGFSVNHGHPLDPALIERTLHALRDREYFRFEVCHESHPRKRTLGGIDDWVRYPVFEKLNDHKVCLDREAAELRRLFALAKEQGRETAIWSHDLCAPRNILEIYPELSTPRGDLNLSHPLMGEFVYGKYAAFFKAVPEADAVVLSMTEVAFPVAHRFDSVWPPEECVRWLIASIYRACREYGKRLIVRPFSAIRADYEAACAALLSLPQDIEIMLKTDPFDWDPFLPLNPALTTYPPGRLTVEFDLGGEYWGRGAFPLIFPDYLTERIEHARRLGVTRAVGRIDRAGLSALDGTERANVAYFAARAADPTVDPRKFAAEQARSAWRTRDPAALAGLFERSFEVVKKMFYADGQLLFHTFFGSLEMAQRNVLFETLCPNNPLGHCRDEWAILCERTTPSTERLIAEKDEAVALAQAIAEGIRRLAPEEAGLHERAETLLRTARLYRAATAAINFYRTSMDARRPDAARLRALAAEIAKAADAIEQLKGPDWFSGQPTRVARQFARDLETAYDLEAALYRDLPGVAADERERLLDFVAVGYPAEGHNMSKFTHGSQAHMESGRCWRTVGRHVAYTLTASAGPVVARCHLSGEGRMTVRAGEGELLSEEWKHGKNWNWLECSFLCPSDRVTVRFDRVSGLVPGVGPIALLRGNC